MCSSSSFRGLLVSALLLLPLGCATHQIPDPEFRVERTLVQVAAELKASETADLYRFGSPRSTSGGNLYRDSVARLQRMEALGVDPGARASLSYAMGLALLRLGRYQEAAGRFDAVAAGVSELAQSARLQASWAHTMVALVAPVAVTDSARELLAALLARRDALLDQLEAMGSHDPHRSLVEVEVERLDVRTREWHWRYQATVGTEIALAFATRVVETHVDSHRALEHLLRLGDMYAELARVTLAQADPADGAFDPTQVRTLVQAAMSSYAQVATIDGRPEREEARAAMIALEMLLLRASSG